MAASMSTLFRMMRETQSLRRSLLSVAVGLMLWEVVGRYLVTDRIFFAPLSAVLSAGWELARSGALLEHVTISLTEFAIGFGLSAAVGIGIGLLMATSRLFQDFLDPWISFFYSSPLVALMPFYILVFGVGLGSKVAITFTVAVFPILLNTFVGVRSVDSKFLEVASAFNCSRLQVFWKILLPAALPYIVVGLRLGIGRGLTGVVVGELFASQAGVGYLIATAGQSFDTPTLFFGVLLFSLIGAVTMSLLGRFERWIAPWRVDAREAR